MKKNIVKIIMATLLSSLLIMQPDFVQAANIKDAGQVVVKDTEVQLIEDAQSLLADDIRIETVSDNEMPVYTEDASNPTPQEVYNAIIAMRSQYPEGMHFDNDDPAGGYLFKGMTNIRMYGYGCAGFAFIMSDAAFGTLPARTIETFDWDAIRVGDILRVNNNSHSVIVLEKHSDYVIVAEGNNNSSVHWGRKISKSEVADGFSYYQTRYPGENSGNNNFEPENKSDSLEDKTILSAVDVRTGTEKTLMVDDGYYKILLFGGIGSCGSTNGALSILSDIVSDYDLKYSEIWAFDIQRNSDSKIIEGCQRNNVADFVNVFNSTSQRGQWDFLYEYCWEAAVEDGLITNNTLSMPLIVFVDDEGNFLDMTVSYVNKDKVYGIMEKNGYFRHEEANRDKMKPIESYVGRLYTIALNREAEAAGLKDWSGKLANGSMTGAQVASGIFFSPEFMNRNLSDEDFVETLYQVMMGRNSDAGGKADWIYKLQNGVSREGVFAGFTGSAEFDNICKSYGIKRGDYKPSQARDRNTGLTTFVARLYTKALGRDYEVAGINYWCEKINSRQWNINDVSTTGFFNSPEFMNKNTTNDQYVTILYHTFFDREPDQAGYNDWMGRLGRGVSRNDILQGFANSPEFANLKKSYGL